jgi:hypothetical protein
MPHFLVAGVGIRSLRMSMKITTVILLAAGACSSAFASLGGSVVVTPNTVSGGQYQYNGVLSNTGTTTIGTLWFAWVPGQNFLAASPTVVTSPLGWSSSIVHAGAGDGYSILWTANSVAAYLPASANLTGFSFRSFTTPAGLAGPSLPHPSFATLTSYVYSGGAFSDNGHQFVATVVPTPGTGGLLVLAALVPLRRRRAAR